MEKQISGAELVRVVGSFKYIATVLQISLHIDNQWQIGGI